MWPTAITTVSRSLQLRAFGKCGGSEGSLYHPVGVAVDNSSFVYVSELENHHVSVFTAAEGQFVRSFGSQGEGPGEFQYPRGLAVDSSGVV